MNTITTATKAKAAIMRAEQKATCTEDIDASPQLRSQFWLTGELNI